MKKLIFIISLFFVLISNVSAGEVKLYLFYSATCPHCKEEKELLEEYKESNPNFTYEAL